MQVVFDTKTFAAAQRREAWREAICEIYLQVDCMAEKQNDYTGFVREARLGAVTLTDTLLSPQSIHRQPHHTAHFDKDCYYFGIEHLGEINIHQSGSSFPLSPGIGTLYYANQPYSLRCYVKSRQFWVELPREAFDRRFESGRPPLLTSISLSRGLGRIAAEFCSSLAQESAHVDETSSELLGEQLMDILALALHGEPGGQSAGEKSVQLARLRFDQGLHRIEFGRPEFVPGDNSETKRYFTAVSPPAVPTDGHLCLGMVEVQAVAKVLRSPEITAKRKSVDHGNRIFHGL